MRIRRRSAVIVTLAAAGALASAGVALANSSTIPDFKVCKANSNCAVNTGPILTSSSLRVHTQTTYDTAGNKTDRLRLYFDKNIRFDPNAVPKCNVAAISGNITMKTAMQACGTKLVGKGTAEFDGATPGQFHACVLAFNRNPAGLMLFFRVELSAPMANCANPATNTSGNTAVLLKSGFGANPGATIPGGPLPAAYYAGGQSLDFNNITAAIPLGMSDLNVRIRKGNYLKAKCTARVGLGAPNKKWVMRALFNYTAGLPLAEAVDARQPVLAIPPCV